MYSQERKLKILDTLKNQDSASVNDLSAVLAASKETIRRDLRAMEAEGLLIRTHGGAYLKKKHTPASSVSKNNIMGNEYPFSVRYNNEVEAKQRIARKAASFIKDRDTIFIDNGTTTFYLLEQIPRDLHLIVITNSIKILMESNRFDNSNISFITLAGMYNSSNYSVYGVPALKSAEDFYPDKAFLSCTGVTPDKQLTDQGLFEIDIRLAMMRKADTTYLLADNTKFTKNGPFYLADITDVDYIITNNYDDKPEIANIAQTITSKYKVPVITS